MRTVWTTVPSTRGSGGTARDEAHREAAQAAHQCAAAVQQVLHGRVEREVGEARQQRADGLLTLDTGQLRAQAVVQTVPERGVAGRVAVDPQLRGLVEPLVVAVG